MNTAKVVAPKIKENRNQPAKKNGKKQKKYPPKKVYAPAEIDIIYAWTFTAKEKE